MPRVHAQDRLNLVVAIDLTRSVATVGPDGKSDFQKDVEGIGGVLAQIPAGTRLTVVGITDHSFTEPYILMRAQVPDDPGYFGEKLTAARNQIVRAWCLKSSRLRPDFKQTDIFGALALASQFFVENTGANRKELVIFSDMRESTPGMDFERMSAVPRYERTMNKQAGLPDLSGVHVNVAGVDGAGKSTAYWAALRRFWEIYFQNARANLEMFTVLAEMRPDP